MKLEKVEFDKDYRVLKNTRKYKVVNQKHNVIDLKLCKKQLRYSKESGGV